MDAISRRTFLAAAAAAIAASGCQTTGAPKMARGAAGKPNFIIFYTDDHGYGDLSCVGASDLQTPHLDGLAAGGARFTNWYSNAPVCSPSRASLLTGRYPGNAGVRSILGGHRSAPGLLPEVPTIAAALKEEGYRTALAGKWHLGAVPPCRPEHHGFDESFGFLAGCIDYYSHIFYWCMPGGFDPVHDLWENGREIYRDGQYFTELITEHAVDFVQRCAAHDEPFFLYVPYNAPHYPMHAPQKYLDRFPDLRWDRRIMAAMLSAVDDSVGAIVHELERQGVRDNTCIFFSSDNGPSRETRNWLDGTTEPYYGGRPGPFKGHKFSLYEGGIRVPAIMNWPGHIPAGQVIGEVGVTMDIFPTFLNAAGGDLAAYELDGIDIMPVAADGAPTPHESVFWEQSGQTALRNGPWKLVLKGQLVEGAAPEDEVHLANVVLDPAERTNLRDQESEIAAELTQAADRWRSGIEARWESYWKPRITSLTADD